MLINVSRRHSSHHAITTDMENHIVYIPLEMSTHSCCIYLDYTTVQKFRLLQMSNLHSLTPVFVACTNEEEGLENHVQ